MRDGFQVIRPRAGAVPAQVIDFQAVRNRADEYLIGHAVREIGLAGAGAVGIGTAGARAAFSRCLCSQSIVMTPRLVSTSLLMLSGQRGQISATDLTFHSLPLTRRVPTVSVLVART